MAKDLEARVAALEKAVAKGLYGGSEEEAMKKWEEQFEAPPASPNFNTPPSEAGGKKASPAAHGKTPAHSGR